MPIIETRNLCKRYGTVMRVTNLALQVPEGSIYGFLGPNGAGKSTTLKMILGLVRLEERQKSLEDIFLELTGGKEVSL